MVAPFGGRGAFPESLCVLEAISEQSSRGLTFLPQQRHGTMATDGGTLIWYAYIVGKGVNDAEIETETIVTYPLFMSVR